MANQIKRCNVSSLTYENFPGDRSDLYRADFSIQLEPACLALAISLIWFQQPAESSLAIAIRVQHSAGSCVFHSIWLYPLNISTSWSVGDQLGMEQSWSLEAAQEQERTEQTQVQTKTGADAEVALEDQLEDENKEAGEEKKRALYELKNQPA
ncbi:hypothetical protein F511_03959 [Dorcoceras hygrometricum]|uniref:Uncharacterized protein n=1 Tax=Dorcoceras hygrometricum TaxID=472368 RepID=A0A2Z7B1D5_9LAMI|nr:hypothetical protein F511_03959 [Dorcoceras hygrometricum]